MSWPSEMAQQIEAFADKPDILSLIPVTHVMEGDNQLLLPLTMHTCFLKKQHKHARKKKKKNTSCNIIPGWAVSPLSSTIFSP